MNTLYLEDLTPGRAFETGTVTVTEAMITGFARDYDPQPFHLDHAAADASLCWGVVRARWTTRNQHGETVADVTPNYWVQARAAAPATD